MNILIVSENFLNGGLETQINTTLNALENNANFFFAFRDYNKEWSLNNVFTGFNFSYNSTVNQFCDDVNKLINIINKNNIDIVHVHPFYSFFPAVFAAKICNKDVVYTYHGISSYSFPSMANDRVLFNLLLDYEVNKIFCVSNEGKKIVENILLDKEKSIFLPNSIDTKKFANTTIQNNKHWALISRLDSDKINEILLILNKMQLLDIKELHIYGNGCEEENLKSYVTTNHLEDKVFFEGYHNNLNEELQGKYNGVLGIGRSAMEAVSMNYPVILLGYNKISGVINDNIYSIVSLENFSNKSLPSISISDLSKQIKNVYNESYDKSFYDKFKTEFDAQIIAQKYLDELKNTVHTSTLNIQNFFTELKKLNQDISFYNNIEVFYLIKRLFSIFCRMPHQNILYSTEELILKQNDIILTLENQKNMLIDHNNKINEHFAKLSQHDSEIKLLSENTMTLGNLKRKIKNKIKH